MRHSSVVCCLAFIAWLVGALPTLLIFGLLTEHYRRRTAEVEARQRMAELAHVNRNSTAGELSTSIAHELNRGRRLSILPSLQSSPGVSPGIILLTEFDCRKRSHERSQGRIH
jgi:hypothetical protein